MKTDSFTRNIAAALLFVVGANVYAADAPCPLSSQSTCQSAHDIVATAVADGHFKTLATALTKAGLVKALQGDGPFTVFAPTDKAFAKLPKETIESLLKPENKKQLQAILKYHVVAGKVPAAKVVKLTNAETLNGNSVIVKAKGGTVMIDGAKVVKADIACSNGIIHVIDSVILPPSKNLAETAIKDGHFKTLVAAAKAAGLVPALTGNKPLTVFAPTDEAFKKLPEGTVADLLKPENKDKLASVLKYHVVAGRKFASDVVSKKKIKTLQGSKARVTVSGGQAMIDGAKILKTDIRCSNGLIHVIDSVILPK